jgi:hypothetical protein
MAEKSQYRIDSIDNQIAQLQASKEREEAVHAKLSELMAQSNYSIEDINFLVETSYAL